MKSSNPLNFKGYEDKVDSFRESTNTEEAVVTGEGKINGIDVVIGVMDSRFMMGSMGSVVGEKITRAIEKATEEKKPIIILQLQVVLECRKEFILLCRWQRLQQPYQNIMKKETYI